MTRSMRSQVSRVLSCTTLFSERSVAAICVFAALSTSHNSFATRITLDFVPRQYLAFLHREFRRSGAGTVTIAALLRGSANRANNSGARAAESFYAPHGACSIS